MLKLKRKSYEKALNHVNKYGDTYIFPLPFEFEAINFSKKDVLDYLEQVDVLNDGIRPYRSEITPKSQVGFRISTQLDPLDTLIYLAIIFEISECLESTRIDKSENIVHSFRLDPQNDGTLFDPEYSWDSFNNTAKEICEANEFEYVIITDIADFYPSIYLHNIETCLRESTSTSGKRNHAEALINIIKAMHINQTHKGLPIGPQFSRPIAEVILNEIDQILIDNDIKFIRYVDDYRIFCRSKNEAYKNISFLAQKFYDLRNLKLNEQKTKILKKEEFQRTYLKIFREKESDRIYNEFYHLCSEIGIGTSFYDEVDLSNLDDSDWEALSELNIYELLVEELDKETPDLGFIKFILNNMARFDNIDAADFLLSEDKITVIFPILKSFITYLEKIRSFSTENQHEIGEKILSLFDESFITELQFNRGWLLHLFTKSDEWNNKDSLYQLFKKYDDNITVRELLLSMGRSRNISYFRENKLAKISSYDPWVRRAFIAGISCIPKDERNPWYKSRKLMQRDFLDKIVEKWVEENPF